MNQEKDADSRLSSIAEEINVEAAHGAEGASSWKRSGASSRPSQPGQSSHSLSGKDSSEHGGNPDSRRDV